MWYQWICVFTGVGSRNRMRLQARTAHHMCNL